MLDARLRLGPVSRYDPVREELWRYSFGVPTDEALDAIVDASPTGIVEIGAGTGYWARLLHDRGADVIAYDRNPPPSTASKFFAGMQPWFPVLEEDGLVATRHADRTLLLVWPNGDEAWPGAAVSGFHAAGGERLVFVGEGADGDTGDSVLHALLGDYGACLVHSLGVLDAPCVCIVEVQWRLVREIPVPQWGGADDSCRFYERAAT